MLITLKRLLILICLLSVSTAFAAKGVNVVYPNWFKSSFYDLPSELKDAKDAGKSGIMVFFSTKTCSYCQAIIETTFKQPDIVKQLRANYDVIGLEVLSDTEVVNLKGKSVWAKDFAVQSKAKFTPTMIFYDSKGKKQLRLIGYQSPEKLRSALSYLKGKHYTRMKLRDYLNRDKTTSKTKSKQKTNLNLDRRRGSDKPLLVVFESVGCTKCQQLRTMLKAPVLKNYVQRFNIAYVNSTDITSRITSPDGKIRSGKTWANQLSLIYSPAMVFFNEQGKEILRVDTDILIDPYGKNVTVNDENILDNILARLRFVLEKGYITLPQFQRWRAKQSKK